MIEEMAFKNIDNILKPIILCILNKIYHAQPYFHLLVVSLLFFSHTTSFFSCVFLFLVNMF